jgi:hypothetical protein
VLLSATELRQVRRRLRIARLLPHMPVLGEKTPHAVSCLVSPRHHNGLLHVHQIDCGALCDIPQRALRPLILAALPGRRLQKLCAQFRQIRHGWSSGRVVPGPGAAGW